MECNINKRNAKIGVCLPTYKRPDQLRQSVRSIIAAGQADAIPIFITDNSADSTNDAVIAELCAAYPHIVYEKNAENLGIDRNVQRCINLCDCDYAWPMGDDDRMLPEAISTLLPLLERDAPAFVAVNYSYVDENIEFILREKQFSQDQNTVKSSEAFFCEDAWAIGFLGSCVINKALWNQVRPDRYLDTYFAHVGVILEAIAGRSVSLVAAPLILNRVGGADVFTWSGDAYGVFHGWAKLIGLLEPVYGAEACRAATASFERGHGLSTLRFLFAKRADRIYNLDIYHQFIRGSDKSRRYKLAAHLVARLPPLPFQGLRALLFLARRQRNRKVARQP